MPASGWPSGAVRGFRAWFVMVGIAAGAVAACASSSSTGSASSSTGAAPTRGAPFFGRRAPTTLDGLVERAVVPARIGGRPTTEAAARALADPGWPIGSTDTAGGTLVSQWLAFRQGPGACWIRIRLLVAPVKDDPTTVELGAQVWLLERLGTTVPLRYARSVFEAFRQDVVSGAQPRAGAHGALRALLNYTDPTGDFVVCGRADSAES